MNEKYRKKIRGKTILITGGTGSFGYTFITKLFDYKPKKIVVFSRDEKKQFDMRNKFNNPALKFLIGDVRDLKRVEEATLGVDFVFHAAALKQVPTCEFFPIEAVKTNILGTHNVLSAAIMNKVKKVVVLSTDKAAYPINVVGISKAMMEKIMIAESKNAIDSGSLRTTLCGVRYGNVLYTRGSVLPYFINLMKQNQRLPITNKYMTRFLLPLPEAIDLVLYALVKGEQGHVYVRKSSACTLEVLAQAVCTVFAYKKGVYEVGIRAGEKMHETLVTREERLRAEELDYYYKIPPESQGLDYNKYFFSGKKAQSEKIEPFTSENTTRLNVEQTVKLLLQLPEIQTEITTMGVGKLRRI